MSIRHHPVSNPAPVDRSLFPLRPGERLLALLSVVGLIAAATFAILSGGTEFLFYIVVVAILMVVVTILHRRVRLAHSSLWALFAWAVLHMAGGMIPLPHPIVKGGGVLYNFWPLPGLLRYDQLIHAYGFGITAWVAWQSLRTIVRPPYTSFGLLAAAAMVAAGLGAVNEVIEFAATKLVEKTNVGDYDNNAWDLVFNLTGATVAVMIIRLTAAASPALTFPTASD